MPDTINSLDQLKDAVGVSAPQAEAAPAREPQRDGLGRSYATGKRKDAVARVWIKPGTGKVSVNGKPDGGVLRPARAPDGDRPSLHRRGRRRRVRRHGDREGRRLSGQAGAVKHGISQALQLYEPSLRGALKAAGYLTRDSRVVERKKYGPRQGPPELPVLQALTARHVRRRGAGIILGAFSFSPDRHVAALLSLKTSCASMTRAASCGVGGGAT
jgi:small subunit ribosomal protein S9